MLSFSLPSEIAREAEATIFDSLIVGWFGGERRVSVWFWTFGDLFPDCPSLERKEEPVV